MKPKARVLGIDDAPFDFDDATVPVVGALMRGPTYLEAVLRTDVTVDGRDATDRVVEMVLGSSHVESLQAVLLDGIAFGGFNVVDLDALHDRIGVPVVTVTRDAPDLDAMRDTLQERFDDWESRWAPIAEGEIRPVATDHAPIHVKAVGIDDDAVDDLVRQFTVRGRIPEPVRVAHLIAGGIATGESGGRA